MSNMKTKIGVYIIQHAAQKLSFLQRDLCLWYSHFKSLVVSVLQFLAEHNNDAYMLMLPHDTKVFKEFSCVCLPWNSAGQTCMWLIKIG